MPPAEHSLTSLSATGETVHGPALFATTHWSVVLEAQGKSPTAQEALEKLCRTYWRPVYGLHQAARHSTRGGGRFHPGLFRAATGAPRFRCCPQGERTFAFLLAHISETFPRQRTAPCDDSETRQRATANSTGGLERDRGN